MHTRRAYGIFSLLELLGVLSIIGILATISFNSYNNARIKARDVRRKADLQTMKVAVASYNAANGHYPVSVIAGFGDYTFATCQGFGAPDWSEIEQSLNPFIGKLPLDPSGNGKCAGNEPYFNDSAKPGHMYMYNTNKKTTDPLDPTKTIERASRYSIWAGLEERNGSLASGIYRNLFFYAIFLQDGNAKGSDTNMPNIYGVGCHLPQPLTTDAVSDSDLWKYEFQQPCVP